MVEIAIIGYKIASQNSYRAYEFGNLTWESPRMTSEEPEKISLEAALQTVEGDVDILKAVVEAFVEETPLLLQEMEQAIQNQDARTTTRAAHTIKGSYRILQQPPLVEVWSELESLAMNNQFDEVQTRFGPARDRSLQVLQQMREFVAE